MSQALRKLTGSISRSNTMVIFINQIRMKIGVMYGTPETTTGGNALKFYASVRLDIRRVSTLKERDEAIGNQVRVKVVKNKVAPPFKQVEFDIMFGEGISKVGELIDLGVKAGIVEKSGAWFSYDSQRLGQGRENAKQFLRDNPEIADRIETAIRQNAGLLADRILEQATPTADDLDEGGGVARTSILLAFRMNLEGRAGQTAAAQMGICRATAKRLRGASLKRMPRFHDTPPGAALRTGHHTGVKARTLAAANRADERRQRNPVGLPRLLRQARPRGRAVEPARAAQRPDPDVHQCRHGAVQERLHRRREAALYAAPRPRRNACAPAASTTTSTMSATRPGTTPSSRCSGNFSFGDYFKPLAIELAWNLITKEFGLPKDKLLVTVFTEDDEAFDLWKKIAGLPDAKIIRIPTSDNFWQMGDTGPCGPCSEIFIDQGEHSCGGPPGSPDEDGDRFIEIWNLVFMQFEQIEPGERIALPKPSIDTGMGLERIAAVLQGVHDNYDTDLFRALIEAVAISTGVRREGAARPRTGSSPIHLRASSFLVADGVLPSNEGRGYVLRRIMRRAMRHAQLLGAKEPVMYRLVPALVREMGAGLPRAGPRRAAHHRDPAARGDPLPQDAGARPLDPRRGDRERWAGQKLSGETAFTLYDTYGFPLDLTQDALKSRGIGVDTEAFNAAMERQREKARAAWAGSGEAATETVWFGIRERVGATEFLGYDTETAEGVVLALVKDGQEVESSRPARAASSSSTRPRSTANPAARSAIPAP